MSRRVALPVLGLLVALTGAAPARATAVLVVDPAASFLFPVPGVGAEPLFGSLHVGTPGLPAAGTRAPFDLLELSLTTPNGLGFALDPSVTDPALGILESDGSFLIPTLFLRVTGPGGSLDVAIPDVPGEALFDPASGRLRELTTSFDVLTEIGGTLSVTLRAEVPEPASFVLGALGLLMLGARGRLWRA
jgi:hypothetical protein